MENVNIHSTKNEMAGLEMRKINEYVIHPRKNRKVRTLLD
jgi:hypothetical protein